MSCNCKHHLDTCPACEAEIESLITEAQECNIALLERAEKAESDRDGAYQRGMFAAADKLALHGYSEQSKFIRSVAQDLKGEEVEK